MKIAFVNNHPYWGGLANNGGSRTILLSCDVLKAMGHDANVVTSSDRFTWFKHAMPWSKIPENADALIAVSISAVNKIMKADCIKAYWARPIEIWQKKEKKAIDLLKKFVRFGGKVMVNSLWQYEHLFQCGLYPYLVYAGMDFSRWRNLEMRDNISRTTILCQYSKNRVKGYKEFKELKNVAPDLSYRIFGKSKKTKWPEIVKVYNNAHYYFVPGKREGWNNCAAEAALCGCVLVVGDNPHNGCSDFVTPENSIVYRDIREALERIRQRDIGDIGNVRERLYRIGNRRKCMQILIDTLKR